MCGSWLLSTGISAFEGSKRKLVQPASKHLAERRLILGQQATALEAQQRLVVDESDGSGGPSGTPWSSCRNMIGERGINLSLKLTLGDKILRHKARLREVGRIARDHGLLSKTERPVEIISPFDHGLEELYMGRFRRAVIEDYKSTVIEALHRIDPGIQDMEVLPGPGGSRPALYLRHTRSGRTPLSVFGDGVRRVLLMALALLSARDGALLIDEIETAIHISVLGDVFKWLVDACRRYDVQLFATTHSLEALDAIIAAGKDDLGAIIGYRFPSPEHGEKPKRYEGYLTVEGPHDLAFVGRLLKLHGLTRVKMLSDLDQFWHPLVPRTYPHRDDLLKRVPVPTFFASDTHSVAVHGVEGSSSNVRGWSTRRSKKVRRRT